MKSKQGEWKKGIWIPSKIETKTLPISLSTSQMIQEARELYIKLWKHKRETLSMAQRYAELQRKIIGINEEDLKE
jgi:hypothetical protein